MKNPIAFLRITALLEAISYLLLLGIAMPLKYIWQQPQAVKIVGAIHGGLFVVFGIALLLALQKGRWPLKRAAFIFAISFLPIVPFFVDRRFHGWIQDYEAGK